jgi:hypothetical protein
MRNNQQMTNAFCPQCLHRALTDVALIEKLENAKEGGKMACKVKGGYSK